jgi:serine/threonine protein kinase
VAEVPRHYIKCRSGLEEYVRQVMPGVIDWESEVIRDITENGSTLVIEFLQPNAQGTRIGLCGDTFYCEAAPDRVRRDCLFVFKVESAARRGPKSAPRRYPANIYRLEWKHSEQLEPTDDLWKGAGEGVARSIVASVEPFTVGASPSDQLVKLLGAIPQEIRTEWRPGRATEEPNNSDEFLSLIRKPWAKFKLERFVRLTTRQESLLKGFVPSASLTSQERLRLLSFFGVNLLNSVVRLSSEVKESSLVELLRLLSSLPLPVAIRAQVWAAMARALDADSFATELREIGPAFDKTASSHAKPIGDWWPALQSILIWRIDALRENYLSDLIEGCNESDDPLSLVSNWIADNITASAERVAELAETLSLDRSSDHPLDRTVLDSDKAKIAEENQPNPPLPVSILVEKWIFALQGLDNDSISSTLLEIRSIAERLIEIASEALQFQSLFKLATALPQIRAKIEGWIGTLPDPSNLSTDLIAGLSAYEQAQALIGSDIDSIIETGRPSARDLVEASGLLKQEDLLRALPAWVWATQDEPTPEASRPQLFRLLLLPPVREKVVSILSAAGEYGTFDPLLIALVPPPPVSDDPESEAVAHDQHVSAWFEKMGALLKEVPEGLLTELRSESQLVSAEARIRQALGLERKLRDHLPKSVVLEAMQDVIRIRSERDAIDRAELYERAVQFWETNFGASLEPTFVQLQSWVDRQSVGASISRTADDLRSGIRIENNWIDKHRGKVPLLFGPAPDQTAKPYGYVSLPMVVISKQKKPYVFGLECDVKSGHRDVWPRDWESPQPSELQIPEEGWRDDPDQPDQYLYTFTLRIPIRRQGRGERFEFNLTLTEATRVLAGPFSFSWDVINDSTTSPLILSWPEVVDPENVVRHPLGPQKKSNEILARVSQCGSFSITAPRRFGKSTLLQFLQTRAIQSGFVVPGPVICTSYYSGPQGLDYERLWQDVSERIQKILGSSMSRSENVIVPSDNAFDHIRRSAKERGSKGIVLLFDEAQLYFSSRSGTMTGDQIKDRLERHWSLSTNQMVPLTIGFIGLPTLQTRAGANLNGLLRPIQYSSLEEADLNRLILAVTSGALNTTREARVRLAHVAGNLYILRTLIEKLSEHVQADGRTWANFNDVHIVELEIRNTLRTGEEQVLAFYIRDILNDAEDINSWEPNPALPLAIAMAEARRKGVPTSRICEEAKSVLVGWYDSLFNDGKASLSYDDQQFDEHLRTLEERGVLREKEFSSVLLEDWLQGLVKRMDQREWKLLLQRSATKRIRIPASLRKANTITGAEANIMLSIGDSNKLAYRVTPLRESGDHERFLRTKEVLENLKKRIAEGAAGSQYIFRISEVGISADCESEAVQVYHWVDGGDLARRIGELSPTYVTDLGTKLARALHFLHSSNIVHRDVSPRNIVLADEGGDPVLIDFGFARWLAPNLKTNVDGEFSAPEVKRPNAEWTKAADIYSLGATLRKVLVPDTICGPLAEVLNKCMNELPEKRPDASRLIRQFDDAAKELHIEMKKAEVWKKVEAITASDRKRALWFGDVLQKLRGNFIAVALGCHPLQFDRCREAANLLNHLFERWCAYNSKSLSIANVKEDNSETGKRLATDAVRFVHWMRNQHSHSRYTPKLPNFIKASPEPDKRSVVLSLEAAEQLGLFMGLSCLDQVVRLMLE